MKLFEFGIVILCMLIGYNSEGQVPYYDLKGASKLYEVIDVYERENERFLDKGQPITLHFLRDFRRIFNLKKLNTDSIFVHCDEYPLGSDSIFFMVNSDYHRIMAEGPPLFISPYKSHELLFFSDIENYIKFSEKDLIKFSKNIRKKFSGGVGTVLPTFVIVESRMEFRIYRSCIPFYPY